MKHKYNLIYIYISEFGKIDSRMKNNICYSDSEYISQKASNTVVLELSHYNNWSCHSCDCLIPAVLLQNAPIIINKPVYMHNKSLIYTMSTPCWL